MRFAKVRFFLRGLDAARLEGSREGCERISDEQL